MTRGRFIALEGGEGAGKSTQIRLLAQALAERNIEAIVTREPGGTPGAETIRDMLLAPPGDGWNPRAEALLFAAARSDHVEKRIIPALEGGKWVICDRFVDSSRAYQGGAGALGDEDIVELHRIGSEGLRPDLTLVLEADAETSKARLSKRDGTTSDAIGGRGDDYHGRVAQAFRMIAQRDPDAIRTIDAGGSPQDVHQRIMAEISHLLADVT